MHRCLQLAAQASGNVAPNPMVGSVLVHEGKIIGEGYHMQYGRAHAEVNCIAAVKEPDQHLIARATLYVSLEPCAHFGKTPPCADLIVEKKIPRVVIGSRDPFPQVDGKGVEKLKAAGVQVELGVLEEACKALNKHFFLFHTEHRPYILLKWAQTADGKIAYTAQNEKVSSTKIQREDAIRKGMEFLGGSGSAATDTRLLISNGYTNRLVHKWRSEVMAIAVGTNTALMDNPQLSTRHWPGNNPVRVVVDRNLRLPASLKLFDGKTPTIVFNLHRHTLPFEKMGKTEWQEMGLGYYQITEDVSLVHQMLNGLYRMGIQSLMVEGGSQLLQSFIDEELWDEAKVITNENLSIGHGLPAPALKGGQLVHSEVLLPDVVRTYRRRLS